MGLVRPTLFPTQLDFVVGRGPSSVTSGDFDENGTLDLVIANNQDASLTVLMGDGNGGFSPPDPPEGIPAQPDTEGQSPAAVAVGDMDGDQRLDLIVANDIESNVVVFLGNRDGTFSAVPAAAVGDGPEGVVLEDFNLDGAVDVATADFFGNTLTVLLGDGHGEFTSRTTVPAGAGPCGLAAADLNGDDVPDLIVATAFDGTVSVFEGNGDGTFRSNVCGGDCNGDGEVTIDELIRGVNIALGAQDLAECVAFDTGADGEVTVDELVRGVNGALNGCTAARFTAGASPAGVAVADVDGDEIADLVVANEGSEFISVLKGFGEGKFDTSQDYDVGGETRAILIADFDRDGRLDVIAASPTRGLVAVLFGSPEGTFGNGQSFAVPPGPSGGLSCQGMITGFVNSDERPDVVTANTEDDSITVLLNAL